MDGFPIFDLSEWEPYVLGIGGGMVIVLLFYIGITLDAILKKLNAIQRELKGLPPDHDP